MHVHQEKTKKRHNKKEALCKQRREALEETRPADTFILDFSLQNCEEITVFKSPSQWHIVMTPFTD
jgi:hypothetical protein